MNCETMRTRLWEFYDEECEPALREQMVGHLASCRRCQASLDEWVALSKRVFDQARHVKASPFLWTRVLAAIESQERAADVPWWVQWRLMSRVAAGLTIAVSLGAAYLYHQSTGSFEGLLEGQPSQHQALRLATAQLATTGTALVTGDIE